MERKESAFLKPGLWVLSILVWLILLLFGGRAVFIYYMLQRMPPETRATYDRWKTQAVSLPPEIYQLAPYRPETIAAAAHWRQLVPGYQSLMLNTLKSFDLEVPGPHGQKLTMPFLKRIYEPGFVIPLDSLKQFDPVLDAYAELVRQPDYDLDAVSAGINVDDKSGDLPIPDFLSIQTMAKIKTLKALALAQAGRCEEALQEAELTVRAAASTHPSYLISDLIAIAVASIGTRAWDGVVERCEDPALLRRTLKQQEELAPRLPTIFEGMDLFSEDVVMGVFCSLARRGVSIPTGTLTGEQWMRLAYQKKAEYLETAVLPSIQGNGQLTQQVEAQIQVARRNPLTGSQGAQGPLPRLLLGNAIQVGWFGIAVPNFDEAFTRAKVMQSQFDLLRLKTAAKLYRLEHGTEPASAEALVPEYLPAWPPDRFGDGKTPISTAPTFHSIGPDQVDDLAAVTYDPTNGTTSRGDVILGTSQTN